MKDKGITLIALIITIIVMMILVGVTVTASLNTKIFKKSQEMAYKEAIQQLQEKVYGPSYISKYTNYSQDYSNLVPDEIKDYIAVLPDGTLTYIGDITKIQYTWAKEVGVLGNEEQVIKTSLDKLMELAENYVAEGKSTVDPNLLFLQYIRYQNSSYRSSKWSETAGAIKTDWINYVNNNKDNVFNIGDIQDPVTGENIDFIHSMASLNALLYTSSLPGPIDQFAGWAGDLCTLTAEVYQWYGTGSYTDAELKEYTKNKLGGNSTFSLGDMLADVDAANISTIAKSGGKIDDIIYNYYYGSSSAGCKNRYATFATYVKARKSTSSTTDSGKIYEVAYYFLGKHNEWFTWAERYAIEIIGSTYSSIPNVVFKTVATCFSEYICERM